MQNMKPGDFMLVILTLALVIFGVIMVFSASYYYSINEYGDQYHYLKRDIVWAASGLVIMLFLATIDYNVYEKFAKPIAIASIVFLVLIFTPLGVTRNNATRWIGVGAGGFSITFMPGEFAKIAAIIFVAWFLSRDTNRIRSFKDWRNAACSACASVCGAHNKAAEPFDGSHRVRHHRRP